MSKLTPARLKYIAFAFYIAVLGAAGYGGYRFYQDNLSSVAYFDGAPTRAVHVFAREGIDGQIFGQEMLYLYITGLMYHPYRWYSVPENFSGKYFHTDKYGFRTNGEPEPDPAKPAASPQAEPKVRVGFFGGSTGFSVKTDDKHTIPALMEGLLADKGVAVKNFSVGGYSLTAELITFVEVARRAPMQYAVFYDGVNELSRYVEYYQDSTNAPYYDTMGYGCFSFISPALHNLPKLMMKKRNADYARRHSDLPKQKIKDIDKTITAANVDEHAENIVRLYMENVRDVAALARGRGVIPVFFWQPEIWSTTKAFTQEELRHRDHHPGFMLLATRVHEKVAALSKRPEMKGILFFDISDALNGLDGEDHFYDFCHIDSVGNALVAKRMAAALEKVLAQTPARAQ